LDGEAQHRVVEAAVEILMNLEHRGAVGGDLTTGDGAGLLLPIPDAFFRMNLKAQAISLPAPGDYAVAMLFLPNDHES
ncbi:MAG: hypothetical protein QF662_04830, partial [Phycisphaerae bacterium]|nr:hypothetical protein [Phycisphaerae bacterium]